MTTPPEIPSQQPLEYHTPSMGGWDRIQAIAKSQRLLLWAVLVSLLLIAPQVFLQVLPPLSALLAALMVLVMVLAAAVFRGYATFKLSQALGYGTGPTIALVIVTFIPCIGIVVLLIVNQQATKALQAAGLRVGLMGASCPPGPPAGWVG